MRIEILGTRAVEPLVAGLRAAGGDVRLVSPDEPEALDAAAAAWSALRDRLGPVTRYNDPARFVRRLRSGQVAADAIPLALLFGAPEPAAVLVGRVMRRRSPLRIGPLRVRTPMLRVFEVPDTGAIVGDDPACAAELARALRALVGRGRLDQLSLRNLTPGGALHAALLARAGGASRVVRERKVRRIARLLDPATGARLQHHSSRTRAGFRRVRKRLEKEFENRIAVEKVTAPEQVDAFVSAAAAIVEQTYQAALGVGVRDAPEYRALLAELAREGELRAYLMRAAGEPIAHAVGELSQRCYAGTGVRTFTLAATAFLPRYARLSPGSALILHVLDDLAAEGVAVFDFGWGEAEYKRRLGSDVVEEEDVRVYARRPRAALPGLVDAALVRARARIERILGESELRANLLARWRERLRRRSAGAPPRSG